MKKTIVGVALVVISLCITSCSTPKQEIFKVKPIKLKPVTIIPTQPDVSAISTTIGPAVWIVAGLPNQRIVAEYSLESSQEIREFPVASSATSVADSLSGVLAVGFGDLAHSVGYINFYSDVYTNFITKLEMPGPVMNLARFGSNGDILALVEIGAAKEIFLINPLDYQILSKINVSNLATAMATGYDPSSFFILESNGQVESVETSNGTPSSLFKTAIVARAIATTQDRSVVLTLQCTPAYCNVVITDASTEQDLNALPAPAAATAIAITDNNYLIDTVGTPQVGNIQVFDVSKVL